MNILNKIFDFLMPGKCVLCSNLVNGSGGLCFSCKNSLPFVKGTICSTCGENLNTLGDKDEEELLCGKCRVNPPLFNKAASAIRYEGAMKKIISQFKYSGKLFLGNDLADIIINQRIFFLEESSIDIILHVPLHHKKLKKRGFDQSYILAERLGKKMDIQVSYNNLIRVKNIESQTTLSIVERAKNVKEAFEVKEPDKLKGKRILIVDDVYTTGATVRECAKTVSKAGTEAIFIITAARA